MSLRTPELLPGSEKNQASAVFNSLLFAQVERLTSCSSASPVLLSPWPLLSFLLPAPGSHTGYSPSSVAH